VSHGKKESTRHLSAAFRPAKGRKNFFSVLCLGEKQREKEKKRKHDYHYMLIFFKSRLSRIFSVQLNKR